MATPNSAPVVSQKPKPLQAVLADSVAYYRDVYDLTQPALAHLMSDVLGFKWTPTTVAKVESGSRRLTAEELIGLSLVLRTQLIDLVWRADKDDPDATGSDVLVGTTAVNNIELTNALLGNGSPALPVLETLTWPAWAVVTGDTGLRDQVDQEMADWEEGMRLLRKDVTDSMRRQERFRRWERLALQYEHPSLDATGAAQVAEMFGRGKVQRRSSKTEVKGVKR